MSQGCIISRSVKSLTVYERKGTCRESLTKHRNAPVKKANAVRQAAINVPRLALNQDKNDHDEDRGRNFSYFVAKKVENPIRQLVYGVLKLHAPSLI